MSRNLSTDYTNALDDAVIYPAVLVDLGFPAQTFYYWTGYGDLTWNGNTYQGLGHLASVSEINEKGTVEAEGITLGLNGIEPSLLAAFLRDAQQGQTVSVHLALLDDDGVLIDVAEDAFSGLFDVPTIVKGNPESNISLSVESRLIELQKSKERRYTNEDQKELFPGDESLRWVAGLQEKEITWGRGD